jgi:amidohydrolase
MPGPQEIMRLAQELEPDILRCRRHLHRHPELSYQESATAAFIAKELGAIGVDCELAVGGTHGIRAVLDSGHPGPVVALRADMDALPITENTGLPFASENPGVMHTCGHDAHTAMLLGTARLFQHLRGRDGFAGTVVFIFQPAEERAPGGAQAMIAGGVLEQPRPDCVIGQHVNPELPAGTVGFRPGLMMASVDDLFVTIKGSGGHGAMPHLCVDPISAAAQIITAAQTVVSRMADPQLPSVLSFGRIIGEGANNIIPGEVRLEGTFRTVDETWRAEALEQIIKLVELTAEAHRTSATVDILRGYPALYNDGKLNGCLSAAAADLLGEAAVRPLPLFMGAEDFAYYGRQVPACFFNLGTGHPDREWNPPLHHPAMDIDESALAIGAATMAWLALSRLDCCIAHNRSPR